MAGVRLRFAQKVTKVRCQTVRCGEMRRVIDNPRSGERIVIHRSGSETDGQLLVFDVFLQPGAHVPAAHTHPRQEERFAVLDGSVRFRVAGHTILARAGEAVAVGPGTPHWFENPGPAVAQVRVEVRPALRLEELFATTARVASSQAGWLARQVDRVLIVLDYRSEVGVPRVPAVLVTGLLTPLAWARGRLRASG